MSARRALHFVFKVGDRKKTLTFYRDILGMKVLRHEEFEEGCKATCNGPYDGKWSKTMIGYGAEDSHFVCELTYNYGISEYALGNDFHGIYIKSSEALSRARGAGLDVEDAGDSFMVQAPGGYKFFLIDTPQPTEQDPVVKVCLSAKSISRTQSFWNTVLGMDIKHGSEKCLSLNYSTSPFLLSFKEIESNVDHAKAFGRIAFACPSDQLPGIEESAKSSDGKVITPYVSLDTPGKATVQVVILADVDGHEICFVGDEGFRSLSQVDPTADNLLNEAMGKDMSSEWFQKHRGGKGEA